MALKPIPVGTVEQTRKCSANLSLAGLSSTCGLDKENELQNNKKSILDKMQAKAKQLNRYRNASRNNRAIQITKEKQELTKWLNKEKYLSPSLGT